jgi:hypothetical protein
VAVSKYSDPYGRPTDGPGFGRGGGSSSTSPRDLLGAWLNLTRNAARVGSAFASGGPGIALEALRRIREQQARSGLSGVSGRSTSGSSGRVTSSRRPGGGRPNASSGSAASSSGYQRKKFEPEFYDELAKARNLLFEADDSLNPARGETMRYFNMLRDRVLPGLEPDSFDMSQANQYPDNQFVQQALRYFANAGADMPIRTFAQGNPETRVNLVGDQNYLRVVPTEGSGVTPGSISAQIPYGLWLDAVLSERGRLPLSFEQQAYLNMLTDRNFLPQQIINDAVAEIPVDTLDQTYEIDPPDSGLSNALAWVNSAKGDPNVSFLAKTYYPEMPNPDKMADTVFHEFGHIADFYPRAFGSFTPRSSGRVEEWAMDSERARSEEYQQVRNADAEHQASINIPEVERWNTLYSPTLGEVDVNEYGANNLKEDFAERFAMYFMDRREGRIGTGVNGEVIRFADLYPNSARFIERFLEERSAAMG